MYCIEIQNPISLSWHVGIVKDIHEDRFFVGYYNNWKNDEWVKCNFCRPLAPVFDYNTFTPNIYDKIEAQARNGTFEPFSWWEAIITDIKPIQGVYTIQFLHFKDQPAYYLQKTNIRPINPYPIITTTSDILTEYIKIPKEILDLSKSYHDKQQQQEEFIESAAEKKVN